MTTESPAGRPASRTPLRSCLLGCAIPLVGILLLGIYLWWPTIRWFVAGLGEEKQFHVNADVYNLRFISPGDSFVGAVIHKASVVPLKVASWDIETGVETTLPVLAQAIDVSQDGHWLVTGDLHGEICLIDLRTNKIARQWQLPEGSALCVAISADGGRIAVGQGPAFRGGGNLQSTGAPLPSYHFWLFDADAQSLGEPVVGFKSFLRAIDVSGDAGIVAIRTADGMFAYWVWSVKDSRFIHEPTEHSATTDMSFTAADSRNVKCSADGTKVFVGYELLNLESGETIDLKFGRGVSCDMTFDGRRVAVGYSSGVAHVVDIDTRTRVWDGRVSRSGGSVFAVALSPDGTQLLTGGLTGRGGFMNPPEPDRGITVYGDPYVRLWKLPDLPK